MLKNYTIENFKSFNIPTTIDLEKTNYQMLSNTNISGNITKGIMFVGANASGKSNSIIAIKFLLDCLFGKNEISFDYYICLFSNNPFLKLNYSFEIDNIDISYNITYQRKDKYLTEKLIVDNKILLDRNGSTAFSEITEKKQYTDIPQSMLFLRDIFFNTQFRGYLVLQKWFSFLSNSIYIDLYDKKISVYREITISLTDYLEKNGTKQINEFFQNYNFCQKIEYDNSSIGENYEIESDKKTIFFNRQEINNPIPFDYESLGNRNLLRLLPAFFHCIENNSMLILDEFSSGFHNELEELLIKYFMEKSRNSQLIFVSHSTNLLTNSLLRPDQIYSVNFNKDGSIIKRFSSEKPREAQNLEKMYLGGVFNGIPRYENQTK